MENNKTVKIEMLNYKGEWVTEEFEIRRVGRPFDYAKNVNLIANKHGMGLDGMFNLSCKYFKECIGKERFLLEGMENDLKFNEVLEEFFQNDTQALMDLMGEVGFLLNPALKMRLEKQNKGLN